MVDTKMKKFGEQLSQCRKQGFLEKTEFQSFEDHPELLPAMPWRPKLKRMMDAIKSGELKGFDRHICGQFGGYCSSGHPECRKMRGVEP